MRTQLILIFFSLQLNAQQVSYVCNSVNETLNINCTNCTGATSYSWKSPTNAITNSQSVVATQAGVWTWTATSNGCAPKVGTHTIYVESEPNMIINAVDICINSPQMISATNIPAGYTYFWTFGTYATPLTSASPTNNVTYTMPGTKTITLNVYKVLPAGICTETCTFTETKTITIGSLIGTSICN